MGALLKSIQLSALLLLPASLLSASQIEFIPPKSGTQFWSTCCSAGKMQVCVGKTCDSVPERWKLLLYVPATYNAEVTAASVTVRGFANFKSCDEAGSSAEYWARGMYPPDSRGVTGIPAHACLMDFP